MPPILQRTTPQTLPILVCVTLLLFCAGQVSATDQEPASKPRRVNPAMVKVEDVPGLPRILLIGDSISVGYTVPVREMLRDEANVHRPLTNCGPTTRGLEQIDRWLGDSNWDVIHFNWGLHDLKYMGPNGENLANPVAPDSRQQVPIDEYKTNLTRLVQRLKRTGAKLIWRSTTPVPEGAAGRVVGDSAKYNAVAEEIMKANSIRIDDHYSLVMGELKSFQRPQNVHFIAEGSKKLAASVAASIREALQQHPEN